MRCLFGILVFVFSLSANVENAKGEDVVVEKGKMVSFEYTLTVDGEVVDTSEGRGALQYTHGEGKIIPDLEKELEGMQVGDEKNVVIAPEKGYGVSSPDAFKEVPRSSLPADVELEVGMSLQAQNDSGGVFPAKVAEIKTDTVIVDFNHPLADKTLNFQVKVVSID